MKSKQNPQKDDLKALAKASLKMAADLKKNPKLAKKFGTHEAFNNGKPVCAFGVLVTKAGFKKKFVAQDVMGNDEVLNVIFNDEVDDPDLIGAAENIADVNDDEDLEGQERAKAIAEQLKVFAKAAKKAAKKA